MPSICSRIVSSSCNTQGCRFLRSRRCVAMLSTTQDVHLQGHQGSSAVRESAATVRSAVRDVSCASDTSAGGECVAWGCSMSSVQANEQDVLAWGSSSAFREDEHSPIAASSSPSMKVARVRCNNDRRCFAAKGDDACTNRRHTQSYTPSIEIVLLIEWKW